MPKSVSPKPESFASSKERDYWHMAQDTAYRAGAVLVHEDGATWLIFDKEREIVVDAPQSDHIWFHTWRVLHEKYQGLSRLWIGGRPLDP
jgi:hypothetical protein